MFCYKCGKELNDGAAFCPFCGNKMIIDTTNTANANPERIHLNPRFEGERYEEKSISYMSGLLTFYLKGKISTDRNNLEMIFPNTILALIPLGKKKKLVPVTHISNVESDFKLNLSRFIVGIVISFLAFAWIGLFLNTDAKSVALVPFIVLIIGIGILLSSFDIELRIYATAGRQFLISFLIFEKRKMSEAEKMIRNITDTRLDDTNNRAVAEEQTNLLINAINNLANKQS